MANAQGSEMDFFNLSVPFKPQVIKTSKEQIDPSNVKTAPPILYQDDDNDCEDHLDGTQMKRNEFKYADSIKDNESSMYLNIRKETQQKKYPSSSPRAFKYSELEQHAPKKNSYLPISRDQKAIVQIINQQQVTVISGPTGCGKTTQVPQFILEHHARRKSYVNIIVTQPRKIAARSIAKRICDERNWQMGKTVGYKVGLDKENASSDTRLLFCTTGIFKKMLMAKKSLNDWTHVILDEVHEREMDMDFVLLLCKRLINTNSSNVKLILMSATIDTQRFQKYFSWPKSSSNENPLYFVDVFEIKESKTFSVEEFYLDDLEEDAQFKGRVCPWPANFEIDSPYLLEDCIHVACQIILNFENLERETDSSEPGSVLVFLPGEAEIFRVKTSLEELSKSHEKAWWILPLHSRIPFEETQLIFDKKKGKRKIILSTNIAESSLTIPDIHYVIDFCLQKLLMADQHTNYVALKLQWADKNSCTQRKGRVGRVHTGSVYRLVPKGFYNEFCESQTAEMIRAPLEKVILDTKLLDFGAPKELLALAIEPPKLKNIHKTTMRLKEIGALHRTSNGKIVLDDGDLSILGEIIASLPLDVCLGKLVMLGHIFNVLDECIIIAAGMSCGTLFSMQFGNKLKAYGDKLYWADRSFSDCIAILVAYQTWYGKIRNGEFNRISENKWCKYRHLQLKVLKEMRLIIDEIKAALQRHDINTLHLHRHKYGNDNITTSDEDCLRLKIVIFGAFYPNYFVPSGSGIEEKEVYKELYNNDTKAHYEPSGSIYFTNFDPNQAKYGMLYEDQIKNFFNGFDDRSIHVEFDGQKVFVQFTPSGDERATSLLDLNKQMSNRSIASARMHISCFILHDVYVAMKLRREAREGIMLKIFEPEIAHQNMLEIDKNCRHLSEPSLAQPLTAVSVGIRDPPSLAQNILHLEINCWDNPNSFWINFLSSKYGTMEKNQLAVLDHEINKLLNNSKLLKKFVDIHQAQKDQIVLAPYERVYYRARIDRVNVRQNTIQVFFIDYGNHDTVPLAQLFVIDMDLVAKFPFLKEIPSLAHQCSLALIKPNPMRNEKGAWDSYSLNAFEDLIKPDNNPEPSTFFGKVVSVVPSSIVKSGHLIYLILFKKSNDLSIYDVDNLDFTKSINYQMQSINDPSGLTLAITSEETYISELNHELRKSQHAFNSTEKAERELSQLQFIGARQNLGEKEEKQKHVSAILQRNMGRRDRRTLSLQLKGPHHPLMFNVVSSHRIGSCKKAIIEPDSVNSVLLRKDAKDRNSTWLVAGHVGTNPTGDSLILRSTTLLPNRAGLGTLLAMSFAPNVEMRHFEMKEYTGCLLGLGYRKRVSNQKTNKCLTSNICDENWSDSITDSSEYISYHPEHDMEIQFDVEVDNEDLDLINELRYRMSIPFTRISHRTEGGSVLPLEKRTRKAPARIAISKYLIEDQEKIQSVLDKLLSKKRKPVNKRTYKPEFHWRQLPETKNLYHPQIRNQDELLLNIISQIRFT